MIFSGLGTPFRGALRAGTGLSRSGGGAPSPWSHQRIRRPHVLSPLGGTRRGRAASEKTPPRLPRPRGLPASHCARARAAPAGAGEAFPGRWLGRLAGRPPRGRPHSPEWHVRLRPCQMPRWAEVRGGPTQGSKPGRGVCSGKPGALTSWPVVSFLSLIISALLTAKLCAGLWNY